MTTTDSRHGFSTIELLITLFIAAAFLMSGYQLYSMIIRDGGEARARAKASNVAYDYLKREKNKIDNSSDCSHAPGATTYPQVPVDSLSNVEIQVFSACAYPTTTDTRTVKTTVTVKYNNPQQTITEATYYATP